MPIVAVLNQKGGVGKTTLATNLAQASYLAGRRTLLIDTDPQSSARDWARARESGDAVPIAALESGPIDQRVKAFRRDYQWIYVDGAPNVKAIAAATIAVADVVLIPVTPSPFDVWAATGIVELVRIRRALTQLPHAAFVVTRAVAGTQLAADVHEPLRAYGLPILRARTHQRVTYVNAAANGLSVVEAEPGGAAAREITAIANELQEYLP